MLIFPWSPLSILCVVFRVHLGAHKQKPSIQEETHIIFLIVSSLLARASVNSGKLIGIPELEDLGVLTRSSDDFFCEGQAADCSIMSLQFWQQWGRKGSNWNAW